MTAALIDLALTGAIQLAATIAKMIDAAQQSGELTAEEATAFRQQMTDGFASSAWQTDAQQAAAKVLSAK